MKIGGGEWKHSQWDREKPGRRVTNNTRRVNRNDASRYRKVKNSKKKQWWQF